MVIREDYEQTIEDVIEKLKTAKASRRRCTLLIGAGCSKSAGIPLAMEFVQIIKDNFAQAYKRAQRKSNPNEPSYPDCMNALDPTERRQLLGQYIDEAKINWGHIAIAQLMKEGYVDRVLTTNFDNLLVRACAMVSLFPAIYDLTAQSSLLPLDELPEHSIFYLHGQSTNFNLKNTMAEVQGQVSHLTPCFNFTDGGRAWIVAGYSGENDPVFNTHIAGVSDFRNSLFWVGYKDNAPAQEVCNALFATDKHAFWIKGHDSDEFFCRVGQGLGCFPPHFVREPFTFLQNMFSMLTSYPLNNYGEAFNVPAVTWEVIEAAKKQMESTYVGNLTAISYYMAGEYNRVINEWETAEGLIKEGMAPVVYSIYWGQGNDLLAQAGDQTCDNAIVLYDKAIKEYDKATSITNKRSEALYNSGLAYGRKAKLQSDAKAGDSYLRSARELGRARSISPNDYDTVLEFGNAIVEVWKRNLMPEGNSTLPIAEEAYTTASLINPKRPEAFWAQGKLMATLLRGVPLEAIEIYIKAATIHFQEALTIDPNFHKAYLTWGQMLSQQAYKARGNEREGLLQEAANKYKKATELAPESCDAWKDWASIILDLSKDKPTEEAKDLYRQAEEKLQQAVNLRPGCISYMMACLSALRGDIASCQTYLNEALQYGTLLPMNNVANDWALENVRSSTWFQEFLQTAYRE